MPLVTLTVRKPKSAEFKAAVLDAVHAALVSTGVPAADRFQRSWSSPRATFASTPLTPTCRARVMRTSYSSKSSGRWAAA